ncbi:iron export ABC transporter permease subunit FetB [Nocardiopsis sp. RSe5-2]|uniref:Iron export ABC transporter permease subunit FetB n=1 Tax=Nocardiopsis endophytica TaxID=3018445 RepID=A0ABT4TYT5_9ACTN|nr:iron export ABC transporter permease subunit FetB [Nocardiopsis endophytica]MDA2809876.1 iron export ABC transporter permease subunit FetB [Nocardiopsis endophytica]
MTAAPSWGAVALCTVFVVLAVGLAHARRLALTRELLWAAARAALQLAAVGAVLGAVFSVAGVPGSLAWVGAMVVLAGQVAGYRGRGLHRARLLATVAIAVGSTATLGLLLAIGVIEPVPQAVVPLGGMIVSGSMQAATLSLRQVRTAIDEARPAIEARLCLGLSARQAFAPHTRSAARTALIPAIDATKVVGLISLPGAMTGLILAGVAPLTAVRYQIIVMYMLLGTNTIAAVLTTYLAQFTAFDAAHRLRPTQAPEE